MKEEFQASMVMNGKFIIDIAQDKKIKENMFDYSQSYYFYFVYQIIN